MEEIIKARGHKNVLATHKRTIEFTKDLEKLERDLIRISPEDEREIKGLLREVRRLRDSPLLTDLGMSVKPPELRSWLDSLRETWQMWGFMRYFTGK